MHITASDHCEGRNRELEQDERQDKNNVEKRIEDIPSLLIMKALQRSLT